MANNSKKGWHITFAVVIFIAFTVICICFLINTSLLKRELYHEAGIYVKDVNAEMADNIVYRMDVDLHFITEFSDTLGKMPRFLLTEDLFERRKEAFSMKEMAVIHFEQGDFTQPYGMLDLKEWQRNNPEVWENPMISNLGSRRILFSAPILSEGTPTGYVLVGSKCYSEVQHLIANTKDQDKGVTFLMSETGELIASSIRKNPNAEAQMQLPDEIFLEKLFAEIQENQLETGEGFLSKIVPEKKLLVAVERLEINNWMQVSIVPLSMVQEKFSGHLMVYFCLVVAAALVSMSVVGYIVLLRKISQKKLEKMAFFDALTEGLSYHGFQMKGAELLEKAGWNSYAVVYFDVYDFKRINENWGMSEGDRTIRYIYRCFLSSITEGELVTRSEMDHFFLLLHGENEQQIAQRVTAMLQKINTFDGVYTGHYRIDFSIGCALIDEPEGDIQIPQDRARRAAQLSEHIDVCSFYNSRVIQKINRENQLNTLFEGSIKNHDFQVYLQPKVYLHQKKPCAAEALVRWIHPEEGMICPSDFIPLFEENGKICQLDFYVFEEVCKMIDRWRKEGRALSEISVNISRMHMKNPQNDFVRKYAAIKEKYQIPDGIIELELTETSMFYEHQFAYVAQIIQNFRKEGFLCALDDFGCGFSSLSLLKEFQIDTIKLDRSFFVNENQKSHVVVANVIRLAHDMDVEVVAEGIENETQVTMLKKLNCDLIQGYFYSKPMPITEFESWQSAQMQKNL